MYAGLTSPLPVLPVLPVLLVSLQWALRLARHAGQAWTLGLEPDSPTRVTLGKGSKRYLSILYFALFCSVFSSYQPSLMLQYYSRRLACTHSLYPHSPAAAAALTESAFIAPSENSYHNPLENSPRT
ncbi:hypothetical protein AOQ84DRAFT_203605 [Glonium stellatum]|uniref:Uncharacterized protein n=1 Tax=Glonium stellatum TaxID=574774 RepID=A0A8E2ENP1_9PEZI|nr:hypothetical protein AOQ84DRAFT_203605 [Glonium stellatum]